MNFKITAEKPLSNLVRSQGFLYWESLVEFVQQLPYGRNSNRYDLSLVIKEQKGSCSSKHAFLAAIAEENAVSQIQLILGMYEMNSQNTKIGDSLENTGLTYIPEAHCYLKIGGKRVDITSANASFSKIEDVILSERSIQPNQVSEFKVDYHQQFIKKWIVHNHIQLTFEEVWGICERCIAYLSGN